jgi:dipeptidyl aminopeptidase/acylaminoacyl peptidase
MAVLIGLVAPEKAPGSFGGRNGRIAFATGNGEEQPYAVLTVRSSGAGYRRVLGPTAGFPGGPSGPQWSRDGKYLLFERHASRDVSTASSLWYSTSSGHKLRRIPIALGRGGIFGYGWSPDGHRVVFSAGQWNSFRVRATIYTMWLDGTHRRALRHGYSPSWSNDGRRILFSREWWPNRRFDRMIRRIYVMRPDGTALRRLTTTDDDSWPTWSPDGRSVLFEREIGAYGSPSDQRQEWRTIGVDGRHEVVVASHPALSDVNYCHPQWSPDGTRIGATRYEPTAPGSDMFKGSFVTLNADGSGEHVVFAIPPAFSFCAFSWQPSH